MGARLAGAMLGCALLAACAAAPRRFTAPPTSPGAGYVVRAGDTLYSIGFRTGIDYHLIHALGLILVGVLRRQQPESRRLRAAAWLMALGILFFSGSLYLLALTGARMMGAVTPLGGLCLIGAWALVAQATLAGKMKP